jgi:hypothetical protein
MELLQEQLETRRSGSNGTKTERGIAHAILSARKGTAKFGGAASESGRASKS